MNFTKKLSFLVILFSLCSTLSFAQETVESVKRQIKAVEAETAREKSLHDAEKKRHAEFIEVGRKKEQTLAGQTKSIKAEIDSLKAELKHIAEARQKSLGTVKWYENKKKKYNESFAKVLEELLPIFESDFPYRNEEAISSVKEIAEQLHKNVIEADDALNRTLEIFYDRIRLGYTTEVWKGFLTIDARQVAGTYLRYGAITQVFISNDGNEVLWLSKENSGYTWQNVSDDLAMRTVLKDVMKVAEGKTAPRLVTIPVSIEKEGK